MAEEQLKLTVLRGGPSNRPEVLLDKQIVSIGRSSNNVVILQDTKVSRYHAEVFRDDHDWLVKDLDSANGVRVNGARCTSRVLLPGDLISIGDTDFRVEKCTPSDAEQLLAAPPPPPIPDGPVTKRSTLRVPILSPEQSAAAPASSAISQDREPIGMLTCAPDERPLTPPTQPPAAVSDHGLGVRTLDAAEPAAAPAPPVAAASLRLIETPRNASLAAELVGLDELANWIVRRAVSFDSSAAALGLPQPGAIAVVGPPGCGKGLAARYAAARWGIPYARLNLAYLLATPPARWTALLAGALAQAAAAGRSVLAVEDIDALETRLELLGDETRRAWYAVLELLAAWVQVKSGAPFVVVTATDPRRLPPSLSTRSAGLDEVFFADLPGHRERLQILENGLRQRGRSSLTLDPDVLVGATEGYSGAEVHGALLEALFAVGSSGRDVTTQDLQAALAPMTPAASRFAKQLDEIRDWAKREARRA